MLLGSNLISALAKPKMITRLQLFG